MDEHRAAANAIRGRARVWVPLAVVGALLALAAGEWAFNRSQPDKESLEAGTVVEFGSDREVSVEVGEGWSVDRSGTNLDMEVVLVHGEVSVTLDVVHFPRPDGVAPKEMWAGMDRVLDAARYGGTEVDLGEPASFTTANIDDGLSGDLRVGDQSGTAYVLPDADGAKAVEARVLGPDAETVAAEVIDSITFKEDA